MTTTPKTMSINSFALGMNNRAPDHKLRTDKGYFLRDAADVDITREGGLKRRRGVTLQLAGQSARSLWADDSAAFYVDGTTLYRLSDALERAAVTGVAPGRQVSFCDAPEGGTYWSDGVRLERIVGSASVGLNPATPNPVPAVAGLAGGLLPEGTYTVLFTAIDAVGRESAPTPGIQVAVPPGGRVQVTVTSAPSTPVAVYISAPNGDTPYYAFTVPAVGTTDYASLEAGRACPTYGLLPLPPGDIVRHFNGRLMVAAGSYLFLSEPFAPGLYRAESGFIPFPSAITVLEAVQGQRPGVYVAADQTYWLAGDITKADLVNVLPYGGVAGSSLPRPDKTAVHWMSPRGLVEASTGGEVKNLQEEVVAITPATGGATLIREANGARHALTSMYGPTTNRAAVASSYMDAEIINGA